MDSVSCPVAGVSREKERKGAAKVDCCSGVEKQQQNNGEGIRGALFRSMVSSWFLHPISQSSVLFDCIRDDEIKSKKKNN